MHIDLHPIWIPRSYNKVADLISKFNDTDDWRVSDDVFKVFNLKWGPHNFDRFASSNNAKCELFNCLHYCPGTAGVDCFKHDWSGYCNWLAPPVKLVPKVLIHMDRCKANGTLVVPKWTSAAFWPLLVNNLGEFKPFIKDHVEYCKPMNFFCSHSHNIFNVNFRSNVFVLRLEFS